MELRRDSRVGVSQRVNVVGRPTGAATHQRLKVRCPVYPPAFDLFAGAATAQLYLDAAVVEGAGDLADGRNRDRSPGREPPGFVIVAGRTDHLACPTMA